MTKKLNSRREFVRQSAVGLLSAPLLAGCATTAGQTKAWQLGCFNRPWSKWGIDTALRGTSEAGYPLFGLLTRTNTDPLIAAEAPEEYRLLLKKKISNSGLKTVMGSLRTRQNVSVAEAVEELRKQIDHASFLGLEYVLTFGVNKPEDYEDYYAMMRETAPYAASKKLKLVIKPHGGGSGAAEEILRCLKKVNHANFKVWYDAGNIIHYTGKDPVAELESIVEHVTGFCAKDCAMEKGEVMIQLGTGKVDFPKVFKKLKSAGFNGPIMLEGCAVGATPEETTKNARANREFLSRTLASI